MVKLKICGMKYPENIQEVSELQPDYLGFIFYDKSPRNFEDTIPLLHSKIKKVGVFVNASLEEIKEKISIHQLHTIQLHGNETVQFCKRLQKFSVEIIKAFSVSDDFDFSVIKEYEAACDYFLFDTKGKNHGGNGITFNWKILEQYTSEKPYFLSGGIGIDEINVLKEFLQTTSGKKCFAIDINSKFETQPGLKNVEMCQLANELIR
jgi:phosphoribosylanthranilate isomerase